MILALIACAPPTEEAPATFDALCRDAYGDYDDEALLAEHVAGLRDWVADHDEPEGWGVDTLSDDDVAAVEHPDRDIDVALGAGGLAPSPFALDSHVALILLADQSVVGNNYDRFDRTFVEGRDCFADGGCDLLRTTNDILKTPLTVKLPYAYDKDYRWVGADTVVARGWSPEVATSEDGSVSMFQSYTLDVFMGDGDGVKRLQVQWAELDLGLLSDTASDEQLLNLSVDELLAVFEDTDEAIEELGL